jgi:hypothetical protein
VIWWPHAGRKSREKPGAGGKHPVFLPERGPWGRANYLGNCSGHVYRRIFEALRPAVFTDPMVGGGTVRGRGSKAVRKGAAARNMGNRTHPGNGAEHAARPICCWPPVEGAGLRSGWPGRKGRRAGEKPLDG